MLGCNIGLHVSKDKCYAKRFAELIQDQIATVKIHAFTNAERAEQADKLLITWVPGDTVAAKDTKACLIHIDSETATRRDSIMALLDDEKTRTKLCNQAKTAAEALKLLLSNPSQNSAMIRGGIQKLRNIIQELQQNIKAIHNEEKYSKVDFHRIVLLLGQLERFKSEESLVKIKEKIDEIAAINEAIIKDYQEERKGLPFKSRIELGVPQQLRGALFSERYCIAHPRVTLDVVRERDSDTATGIIHSPPAKRKRVVEDKKEKEKMPSFLPKERAVAISDSSPENTFVDPSPGCYQHGNP